MFISEKAYLANTNLEMCFTVKSSGEKVTVSYDKKAEFIERYKLVKYVTCVTFLSHIFEKGESLTYFYSFNDKTSICEIDPTTDRRRMRTFTPKYTNLQVVDGLAFFKEDVLSDEELSVRKMKVLRSLISLDHLWHQSIMMEYNGMIEDLDTIFQCLCLKDLQYKHQFDKVN